MSDYPQKEEGLTMPEGIKREFKGIWIPKEIWFMDELSPVEKVLLAEIDSLDGEDGCFASNEYFAKFLHQKNSNRITDMIKNLCDLKLIEKVGFNGRRRVLRSLVKGRLPTLKKVGSLPLKRKAAYPSEGNIYNSLENNDSTEDKKDVFLKNKKTSKKLLFSIQDYFEVIEAKLESLGQSRMLEPLKATFTIFFQHRIELHEQDKKKIPLLNKTSTNILVKKLVEESNLDHKRANDMMETAILSGWRGVHPVGYNGKQSKNGREKDDLSVDDNPYEGFF